MLNDQRTGFLVNRIVIEHERCKFPVPNQVWLYEILFLKQKQIVKKKKTSAESLEQIIFV